jgi:outer membrane protein assembly factor BamB
MFCVKLDTGEVVWKVSGHCSSPTFWDDKVYFGRHKSIVCFDSRTFMMLWSFETDNYVEDAPLIHGGLLYFGGDDKYLYSLDAISGEMVWKFKMEKKIHMSPVIAGDKVYCQTSKTLYCLDRFTSKEIWRKKIDTHFCSAPVIYENQLVIGSTDGNLYRINQETGETIWSFGTGAGISTSVAVVGDFAYFGNKTGSFLCVDMTNKKVIWEYKTADSIFSSPAICDGKVYFGSTDNNFHCLDAKTGKSLWAFRTSNRVWMSPVVANGKIVVGSSFNELYCFGDASPLAERDKPERLIIHSESEVVELCDTLQFSAFVVNQYNDILPGYELEWSVNGAGGVIDKNGLFTPDSEGSTMIVCKAGDFEEYIMVLSGNYLFCNVETLEFTDVVPGKECVQSITFEHDPEKAVNVKLSSASDSISFNPGEFTINFDARKVVVDVSCRIEKIPDQPKSKFSIIAEYELEGGNGKCRIEIPVVIRYKKVVLL